MELRVVDTFSVNVKLVDRAIDDILDTHLSYLIARVIAALSKMFSLIIGAEEIAADRKEANSKFVNETINKVSPFYSLELHVVQSISPHSRMRR